MKRRNGVSIGLIVLIATGCAKQHYREGTFVDPETKTVYENAYYVDPSGWTISEVWTLPDAFPRYWQMKEGKEGMGPEGMAKIYARAWATKHATGVYKANLYAISRGAYNFRILRIDLPEDLRLRWTNQSRIQLVTIDKGDTLRYESREILFTKSEQYYVFRPTEAPVVLTRSGDWDVPGRGILAMVRFDFEDHTPENILYCEVKNVEAAGDSVSSSQ